MPRYPEHIESLRANIGEVKRLLEIHSELTGTAAGRRHNVQVLNKSAILMLVASWESVIETLAICATNFICDELPHPEGLPSKMMRATSLRLEGEKHDNEVWLLAGEGWRYALRDSTDIEVSRLNTPNAKNIDRLFERTLGYSNMSRQWKWKGSSRRSVIDRLDNLIELRHEIAHQVSASRSVTKKYVENSRELIGRVTAISSNRICTHLRDICGSQPWQNFRMGSTS